MNYILLGVVLFFTGMLLMKVQGALGVIVGAVGIALALKGRNKLDRKS